MHFISSIFLKKILYISKRLHDVLFSVTTLYPFYKTMKSCNLVKECNFIINFKKKKNRPVQNMGETSKVMPQSQSIPPGKGGKPHGKKSKPFELNIVWLNRTHCFFVFKITGKFFIFKVLFLTNFQRIMQIWHNLPTIP